MIAIIPFDTRTAGPATAAGMDFQDYKSFWNDKASTPRGALVAVDGSHDERTIRLTGAFSAAQARAAFADPDGPYFDFWRYLIGVLSKKLMQAHTPPEYVALGGSLNQLPPRRTTSDEEVDNGDDEEVDVLSDVISLDSRLSIDHDLAPHPHAKIRYSSKATRTFRDRHTIVYTANEALQRMFLSYQLRVRRKTMQLVDEDERDALLQKSHVTCNVLISYSDLRASLLEVWELFEPGRVALSEEEIEEVLEGEEAEAAREEVIVTEKVGVWLTK